MKTLHSLNITNLTEIIEHDRLYLIAQKPVVGDSSATKTEAVNLAITILERLEIIDNEIHVKGSWQCRR